MNVNLRLLDVDRLADECAEHTAKFFSRTTHDIGYCYELFRRAIVGRNHYAWEKVHHQYQALVSKWVRHHSGLPDTGEEVDYFVNCAFEKMWLAIDAEKFNKFPDVAELLRYFKMCVHSVIVDYKRVNPINSVDMEPLTPLLHQNLPSVEEQVTDQLERQRLWETVTALTQNEKESIILKFTFLYDLRPSEIYEANSDVFESLDELYRVKRNLLKRLRRNPALQPFLTQNGLR